MKPRTWTLEEIEADLAATRPPPPGPQHPHCRCAPQPTGLRLEFGLNADLRALLEEGGDDGHP